jgi:hypothetical protein
VLEQATDALQTFWEGHSEQYLKVWVAPPEGVEWQSNQWLSVTGQEVIRAPQGHGDWILKASV